MYSTKQQAMKKCGGSEVYVHSFLGSSSYFKETDVHFYHHVKLILYWTLYCNTRLVSVIQSNRIVLTDENVRDIEARLQFSPPKSLRRLAQETGVSLESAFTATKLMKYHPYKITVVYEQ
jgi:hypothetical protein